MAERDLSRDAYVLDRWSQLEAELGARLATRDLPGALAAISAIDALGALNGVAGSPDDLPRWTRLRKQHEENMAALAAWTSDVREQLLLVNRAREAARASRQAARHGRWLDRSG